MSLNLEKQLLFVCAFIPLVEGDGTDNNASMDSITMIL